MKKAFLLSMMSTCLIVGLAGCGGGGDGGPTFTVGDTPATGGDTPTPAATSCSGLGYIPLLSVQSSAATSSGFDAANAIDNSLNATDRWQSTENGAQLTIDLGYRYEVKEIGTAWYQGDQSVSTFDIAFSEDGNTFTDSLTAEESSGNTQSFERFDVQDTPARYVRITSYGNTVNNTSALLEAAVFGCSLDDSSPVREDQVVSLAQFNLDASAPPGENFDLLTWALDTPKTDPSDGFSQRASERELDAGFEDPDHFYTGDDGGMVFRSTIFGAKTSANTSFTRSELREMLRRGNTSISTQGVNQNNWILGYQPNPGRTVGGRGGILKATLKVDHLTTTGTLAHQGRVVIGQIHADNDEPIRLYFKKYPNNERGYVYFAHEIRDGDDIYRVVLGEEHSNEDEAPYYQTNPEQGIALGEIFSYEIDQTGARIDVILRRGDLNGPIIGHNYVDMDELNSGYDISTEWMYFKAGAYSQNNTGSSGDANGVGSEYEQITFYELTKSHGAQ